MTFDLSSLGWNAEFDAAYRPFDDGDHRPGRVLRADRGICTVLTADGTVRASLAGAILALAARDPVALPCAGDWLVVRTWPDERVTAEAVLPRRTAVVRRTADKDSSGQVLAANMDAAAVVEPMDPTPDAGRIERLLALAWESGAQPLVVLTKADLVADPAAVAAHVADVAPGVEVVAVAAREARAGAGGSDGAGGELDGADGGLGGGPGGGLGGGLGGGPDGARGHGLDRLLPLVAPGRTLGLLGPSGAGKSTLVNALAGASVMTVQAIRRVDGKGRHTTTYRALVPIPGGGAVLDTPGIRAVGLLDAAGGLEQTFADVTDLVAACRFADCGHDSEPGCAIRAALESGDLSPRRYDNWRRLQREVAYERRRRDVRLAAEERARWKRIHADQRIRGHRP